MKGEVDQEVNNRWDLPNLDCQSTDRFGSIVNCCLTSVSSTSFFLRSQSPQLLLHLLFFYFIPASQLLVAVYRWSYYLSSLCVAYLVCLLFMIENNEIINVTHHQKRSRGRRNGISRTGEQQKGVRWKAEQSMHLKNRDSR